MAKAIAVQESTGTHYWAGNGVGTASHARYPLMPEGGGSAYGVMQLSYGPFLNRDTIWNWKSNIDRAMEYIHTCYSAGKTHLNQHPAEVTARMRRLEGYARYFAGQADRYHWWSTGPEDHNGVPQGWTKFGYTPNASMAYRDYNNDGEADPDGNPYNIPDGPSGENTLANRSAKYADDAISKEP